MRYLTFLLIYILTINGNAQDTTVFSSNFSRYYNSDDLIDTKFVGGNIIEQDTGYLIRYNKASADSTCISLMKIDETGNQIWDKDIFCRPLLTNYPNIKSVLGVGGVKKDKGDLIMVVQETIQYQNYNNKIHNGGLIKFNQNGDTIWTRFLDPSTFDFEFFMDISLTSDGGYITAGRYRLLDQQDNVPYRGYIVKFDSLGYKEWEWKDEYIWGGYNTVFENKNGDIIAGGVTENPEGFTYDDIYVLRLSSEGEYIDEYFYANQYSHDASGAVHPFGENHYLVTGGIIDLDDWDNFYKEFVALLDTNFNPIWEKTNPTSLNGELGAFGLQPKVVVFPDGSFVGYGDKNSVVYDTTEYATDTPTLMFYSSMGELEKVVTFQLEETAHEHVTYDLIGTSDGGLMLMGTTNWPNPDLDIYVIKTDGEGNTCTPADCVELLSYEIIYTDTTEVSDSIPSSLFGLDYSNELSFSPNPANKHSRLLINKGVSYQEILYAQIQNSQGKVIDYREIGRQLPQIDTENLPEGLYIISIYNSQKQSLGVGKLIVTH